MPSEVNPSTVRAALYARVSSDLQSAASIDDQLRVCAEWAANQGLLVTGSYTDQGISGASLNRPGIKQLLQDAAVRKFDMILTESLDRRQVRRRQQLRVRRHQEDRRQRRAGPR
jgi:DNA invertase Pin-like site-specific DNA recombinase